MNTVMQRMCFAVLFALVTCIRMPTVTMGANISSTPVPASNKGVDRVLELHISNFTGVVSRHDFVVIQFYAPWCTHCQRLAPIYEDAAALLEQPSSHIVLAKVDVSDPANEKLIKDHHVEGVPALKILQGGIERDYKGALTDAESIAVYLRRQSDPPCPEITSAEEASAVVRSADFVVIGVFEPSSGDPEADSVKGKLDIFMSLAKDLRSEYEFRYTANAMHLPPLKEGNVSSPSILIFKSFDEGFHQLTDFEDAKGIKEFLAESSIPSVIWFNKDATQRSYASKVFASHGDDGLVFLFSDHSVLERDAGDDTGYEAMERAYKQAARDYRGRGLRFFVADAENGKKAMEYFGVRPAKQDVPLSVVVLQGKDGKKYKLDNANATNLEAWLRHYFGGRLTEYFKSEVAAENESGSTVRVLAADTFESMVLQSSKNVLLELYAPWCSHCQELLPVLEEVSRSLQATDPDVLIYKMDAIANDVPDSRFQVKDFPTIYLYSTVSKNVIHFDGSVYDRNKQGILSFIHAHKESTSQSAHPTTEASMSTAVTAEESVLSSVNEEL
ncbi:hypothetical protein KP509_1Z289700 [Ceratopteris richardii]|nr:hypothetical protein KP509_1Z289700 [Ceratopteris richardii]